MSSKRINFYKINLKLYIEGLEFTQFGLNIILYKYGIIDLISGLGLPNNIRICMGTKEPVKHEI